jgi:hypothetical protein
MASVKNGLQQRYGDPELIIRKIEIKNIML